MTQRQTDQQPSQEKAGDIHDSVRRYYREAAEQGASPSDCHDERWGARLYDDAALEQASDSTAELSMGCGNPFALAELAEGETVLDLGSGGGLDVILSARRVGATGKAYGLDFLPEMLTVAEANAVEAGVNNIEFLQGMIEDIPLPDASVDVVISNCVINLAPDKSPVFAEMARVLRPGGRIAISDVVAESGSQIPSDGEAWAECGAGALPHDRYLEMLREAGFSNPTIEFTHQTGPGLHAAAVRAHRA